MSASEIYSFLEESTLCAYASLTDEVEKLKVQGISDFNHLANVSEEELDRWSVFPLVKHALAEGNKIKKLPSPQQVAETQPPLKEMLDVILPLVEASLQEILGKFKKDVEEVIDRKIAEFHTNYVLEVDCRPQKKTIGNSPAVFGNAGEEM